MLIPRSSLEIDFPRGSIPPDEEGIVPHSDESPITAIAGKCVSASTEEINPD